ncbi:MAG: nuclear transport factor 2 family protein [Parasporobacterium sp.]|nr:nuclear transport factor 2 family protein [Parasporobacterium sp.]
MKKKIRLLAAAVFAAVMVFGMAGSVLAAEAGDADLATVYKMAQKALDQQAIQNVMSRHVMYHCYGLHQEEVEQIWVQEPENQATASFGQNQGYMVGYPAIWEAYVDGHTESWLETAKNYCAKNDIDIEGWSDEEILDVYGGVGQLLLHVTTTSIIEVAEDGQTAKCFWYSPGLVAETGQSGNTIWEAYGVDFVKEGGEWKIWHLHMYTDFTGSFYITLGGNGGSGGGPGGGQAPPEGDSGDGQSPEGESPEGEAPPAAQTGNEQQGWQPEGGEAIAIETVNEYLSEPTYTIFSSKRLRSQMELYIPTPYETWSFDDPNYGLSVEQYAKYGIDLDAWYAAHAQ